MNLRTTDTIFLEVALDAQNEPPKEFRIFTKGEIKTRKGRFLFDDAAAAEVMRKAAEAGVEFCLDYAHAMLREGLVPPLDPAESNKAAGWFKPELRGGELWATDVRWTPRARKHLVDREFRYVSPTFNAKKGDEPRQITEMMNVALTNMPATTHIAPLMADARGAGEEEETETMTTQLIALAVALGLTDKATEPEIFRAASRDHSTAEELVRLSGAEDVPSALKTIAGWKKSADKVVELERQVEKVTLDAKKTAVAAKVKAKVSAGVVKPADEEDLVELGMSLDEERFDKHLGKFTVKLSREGGPVDKNKLPPATGKKDAAAAAGEDDGAEPSDGELVLLGMTREDFQKARAREAQKGIS